MHCKLHIVYDPPLQCACAHALQLGFVSFSAILNATEEPIVVTRSQDVTLSCMTACGSIEWLHGNIIKIDKPMFLCTNNGTTCDTSVNSLGCANAEGEKFVGSTLTFTPHETMKVWCQTRFTNIGVSCIFRIPSKAALIILKGKPTAMQPNEGS